MPGLCRLWNFQSQTFGGTVGGRRWRDRRQRFVKQMNAHLEARAYNRWECAEYARELLPRSDNCGAALTSELQSNLC